MPQPPLRARPGKELGWKLLKLAVDLAWKELGNNCASHRQVAVGKDCWSKRASDLRVQAGPEVPSGKKSQFCTTGSIFSWIWPCCSKSSAVPSLSQTHFGPVNTTSVPHAMRQRLLSHAAWRAVPCCSWKGHRATTMSPGLQASQHDRELARAPSGHWERLNQTQVLYPFPYKVFLNPHQLTCAM